MTRYLLIIGMALLFTGPVEAGTVTLGWHYGTLDGSPGVTPLTAEIQRADAPTGPFQTVATIPSEPASYHAAQEPNTTVYYRIKNVGGVSNVLAVGLVESSPLDAVLEQIIRDLTEVKALVTRPESNFTVRYPDINTLEIEGVCGSIKTTGRGTERTMECLH